MHGTSGDAGRSERIGEVVRECNLACWAAAIMPDHVHMVFARQAQDAEAWIGYFKRGGSRELRKSGLHPFADKAARDGSVPTPWAEGGWKGFLHTAEEILLAIRYVEENPIRAGLPPQRWNCVTPFCA
jgi:REP element-mobilizing transposase RayT